MDEQLETVLIKTPNGPVVFNKKDFDPEKHELFDEKDQKPAEKYSVETNGKTGAEELFFIVEKATGMPVQDEQVEIAGYKTKKEAFAVVKKLK